MNESSRTASSRRSAPSADSRPAFVALVDDAVAACLDREAAGGAQGSPLQARILVAYSGGIDSTVLLHAAAQGTHRARLAALYVHHGLQAVADSWPDHCRSVARTLGVDFECVRLEEFPARGASLEEWARDERHRAFARVAARLGARVVLTAHHADDQVETILMRIARGTGVDGLAGMSAVTEREGLRVVRPLLDIGRADVERYARHFGLRWVEDPSNRDTRRQRNAIRHVVLPAIEREDASFRASLLARLPAIRAERARLAGRAATDLARARREDGSLDRGTLAALEPDRQCVALRAWLAGMGLRAPTRARLDQILHQLVRGRGAQGLVRHEGVVLARYRNRVEAVGADAFAAVQRAGRARPTALRWNGEAFVELPGSLGRLCFDVREAHEPAAPGTVDAGWLRGQALLVAPGGPEHRIRVDPRRPTRTLKNLYQELGVPSWMRPALPRTFVDGRLLHAAGIGQDCSPEWPRGVPCVSIRWEPPTRDDPRARFGASHQVQFTVS